MNLSSLPKLRVAQVGVAKFGAKRRALMRETGLFQIEALYDWNPAALALAAQEERARPVESYEELLDYPGLEAVMISTGAKFHAEQIIQALDRGLHVFVEKPLCSTPAEMQALQAAQERTGLVVGMGHVRHSTDSYTELVRQTIEGGELGRILAFEHTVAHSGGWHIPEGGWRGERATNPGGMLFHCGVHEIHELLYLFGPITQVYATIRYDLHSTETADGAQCLLTFDSGLTGTLSTFHVTAYHQSSRIFGTEATLYREKDETLRERIWKQRRHPQRMEEFREEIALPKSRDETGNLRSFYEAVRFGTEPDSSMTDGARALSVVFAAMESAEMGAAVKVDQGNGILST